MKKVIIFLIVLFSHVYLFAQDFDFPPELNWWIYEIQKIDQKVQINNFKFDRQRTIAKEKGSTSGLDSFCWLTDTKIIAVGRYYLNSTDAFCDLEFIIYEYTIKEKEIVVKEFVYPLTKVDSNQLKQLNFTWLSQRDDYFEQLD